jgi:glycosyltransferase involved in cell wall biosynthesis
MRVLVDARPALETPGTGVTHYTRAILRHLPQADPEGRYVAWYLHARGLLRARRFFKDVPGGLEELASRFPARVFQPASHRLGVPRIEWLAGRFDVLLATNFLPPATGNGDRAVPVVHDLAFDRLPSSAPHHDARWRRRFEAALRDAARVIVPSESAKADLCELYSLDPARIEAIHHGIDQDFKRASPDEVDEIRHRFRINGPYALFVGGVEPRKNLEAFVRAFAGIPAPAHLVISGGRVAWDRGAFDRLQAAVRSLPENARGRIVLTGWVSHADKVALLSGAEALAYPSRYEGFGFPVLEGFVSGVPVLTSNVSSLPEVAGDAALLVDPTDEEGIRAGLVRLFEDEALRRSLRDAGLARAQTFTWAAAARATARVLHSVGDR